MSPSSARARGWRCWSAVLVTPVAAALIVAIPPAVQVASVGPASGDVTTVALPTRVISSQRLVPGPDLVSLDGAPDDVTFHEMAETSVTAGPGVAVRSDAAGVKATPGNVVFTVTSPKSGNIVFNKNGGKTLIGHRRLGGGDITAPDGTVNAPLRIAIAVDVSGLPAGLPIGSVAILRNEEPAGECTSTKAATPDPCIVSRSRTGNELTVTVLSSKASSWTATRPFVERVFGDDRLKTAIATSRNGFADGGASAVVLVRSDLFADALPATPLAAAKKGPVLLTPGASLDDATLAEITRVLPAGKTVYLLGGERALSAAVPEKLVRWGFVPVRYFGETRFETAVVVARDGLGSPGVAILANGNDFADALAAGPAAVKAGGAVLLTNGDQMPAVTASYLASKTMTRYAVGGLAAKADTTATGFVGDDRYETSVLVAKKFFTDPGAIGVVSGTAYADALGGGAHIAAAGGPLLAVPASGVLPPPVKIYLRATPVDPPQMFLYGGTGAVSSDMAIQLRQELGA